MSGRRNLSKSRPSNNSSSVSNLSSSLNGGASPRKGGVLQRSAVLSGSSLLTTSSQAKLASSQQQPASASGSFPISKSAMTKLVVFSILMFTIPFVFFFLTKRYWYPDDLIMCGLAAIVAVQLVVIAFVIMAFLDGSDSHDRLKSD